MRLGSAKLWDFEPASSLSLSLSSNCFSSSSHESKRPMQSFDLRAPAALALPGADEDINVAAGYLTRALLFSVSKFEVVCLYNAEEKQGISVGMTFSSLHTIHEDFYSTCTHVKVNEADWCIPRLRSVPSEEVYCAAIVLLGGF
ncbi:hypothetical protein MRB53_004722 [Persea americana]|uniref:Uncharacterized protein n=1 Tax=Persea americana TaxID=3435 RepID=A0ACC2MCA0_PERAE|nr:hypothetical protein MRB53_004722 [Persea americana]